MTIKWLFRTFLFLSLVSLLSGCSAEKRFHRRLVGTWDVVRYEQRFANGETQVSSDLGTVTFKRNGSGDNDVSVMTRSARTPDTNSFSWNNTIDQVTIISRNTYLAKSWIVVKNKKSTQIWKSTNQANVQTMELHKR